MKYWVTLIVTMLILIAVLIPGSTVPNVKVIGFDKVVHFCMFFIWFMAVCYDFRTSSKPLIILIGFLFSLLTELLQLLTEDRSFDLYDMVADATGLLVGRVLHSTIFKFLNHLKRF